MIQFGRAWEVMWCGVTFYLVHDLGVVLVEVLRHLQAKQDPAVGVELTGLNRVLWVER